jgi:ABC-type antimicrobial peptide transport system permease subunit
MKTLVDELQRQPDVASVAITDHALFTNFTFPASIERDGAAPTDPTISLRRWQMSNELLDVLRVPLVAGTAWSSRWHTRDTTALKVGMLNEAAARKIFPNAAPSAVVGRTVRVKANPDVTVLITGIVRDTRTTSIGKADELHFYQPWSQGWKTGQFHVYVRARDNSIDVRPTIQKVAHSLDANLPVYGLRTLSSEVDEQITEQRFTAHLSLALAVTGIILAVLGLYGTLSYTVHERMREIGVRAALGARPAELLSRVLVSGLTVTAIGVLAGLIMSFYLSRFIGSRRYGVTPFDGSTYAGVSLLLFAVATAASAIPGWRASRVDPMAVLRYD